MEKINVEQIMQEIRQEIKKRGLDKEVLSFEDIPFTPQREALDIAGDPFSLEDFIFNVDLMNENYAINPYRGVGGNPIVRLLKRIIRKFTTILVGPTATAQTNFNSFSVRSLNALRNYVIEEQKQTIRMVELEKRIEVLEKLLGEREKN